MTSRLMRWIDGLAGLGLCGGLLVRITVRDAWPVTALFFYATPLAVLAIVSAWLGWRAWRVRKQRLAALAMPLTGFLMWFNQDWKWHAPSTEPSSLRIVHWNVARPEGRLPHIVERLHAYDADVIAVAEAMPDDHATVDRWPAEFPGYEAVFSDGEMLCLVRGEVRHHESGRLGEKSFYTALDVTVKGHLFTILQVDLVATPWRSRREPLQALAALVAARMDRPLIVLGDFNTPRESALFDPLRAQLTHAWEDAGQGCADTWPMPVPVLSLDHVWVGRMGLPSLHPVRCEHGVSMWSDHRPVVVDLAWLGRDR